MKPGKYHPQTKLVQNFKPREKGAVNKPIYQSTSFNYSTAEELEKVFNNKEEGFVYSRINNPTNRDLEEKLNQLEDGIGAVVTSSGMAAISVALLSLLNRGDHLVAGSALFGGTYNFIKKNLKSKGIESSFVEPADIRGFQQAVNSHTKAIFIESVGNPGLEIPDILEVSSVAQNHDIPLLVDNTFLTSYLFRPGEYGADVSIYSASKYINGSANSLGGIIIDQGSFDWTKDKLTSLKDYRQYGAYTYLAKIRQDTFRNLGSTASPFNSFLNDLGLGTLGLRMEKHCANALELAHFFKNHSSVQNVKYPGLSSHPQREIVKKQFAGKGSGVLTLELKNKKQCFQLINNLDLVKNIANLGDIRTLIIHPASTIYSSLSEKEWDNMGITSGLLRVSVGIEEIKDIKKDFVKALKKTT